MNIDSASDDDAPRLERCFLFDAVEDSYFVSKISGRIPRRLRGTYYINGPARFQRAGLQYKHWLDGDGMLCALRFGEDAVSFTNKFVRTPKLRDEEAAGAPIYRCFGTRFPGDRLRRGVMLEPPVNVSAYPFAGRLLAFGEQAIPFEMDPDTLETRGEYDFGGSLTEVTPFSAHPKYDPATGHMLNFGVSFSASQPMLNVYEFDSRGALIRRRRHPLKLQHSNHDFGISENYAVFYLSPLLMNFNKFWGEGVSIMESLSWEPEKGSRIFVAPRESRSDASFTIEVGHGKCLHLINCFESGRGILNVDVLELEAPVYPEYQPIPDLFQNLSRCRPVRYMIHIPSRSLLERKSMEYDRGPDFPSIDKSRTGRPYSDFWMLGISKTGAPGRKFFDQLAHGSWDREGVCDIYQTAAGKYLAGEPTYVAGPADPDDAVIIVQQLDTAQDVSEILLFEAARVASGPIARFGLRHKIHPGFHTSFRHA